MALNGCVVFAGVNPAIYKYFFQIVCFLPDNQRLLTLKKKETWGLQLNECETESQIKRSQGTKRLFLNHLCLRGFNHRE